LLLSAAGDEGLVGHPADAAKLGDVVRLIGGPALFLAGSLMVKRLICGGIMNSHAAGIFILALASPLAIGLPLFVLGGGVAGILVGVAIWEERAIRARRRRMGQSPNAGSEEKISMVEA
jgi:low temperature requirement protein LtrA